MKTLRRLAERALWSAAESMFPGATVARDAVAEAVAEWEKGARAPLVVPSSSAPASAPSDPEPSAAAAEGDTIIVDICDPQGRIVGTTTATIRRRR
jgi:hypothetical protein